MNIGSHPQSTDDRQIPKLLTGRNFLYLSELCLYNLFWFEIFYSKSHKNELYSELPEKVNQNL